MHLVKKMTAHVVGKVGASQIVAVLFLGPSKDFHGIFVPAQAHRHQPIIELNR